jgi:hypothetical protein
LVTKRLWFGVARNRHLAPVHITLRLAIWAHGILHTVCMRYPGCPGEHKLFFVPILGWESSPRHTSPGVQSECLFNKVPATCACNSAHHLHALVRPSHAHCQEQPGESARGNLGISCIL